MVSVQIIRANALDLPLADDSVDLVVTSPPYFGLRSYQDSGQHYEGQIGDEATPAEFVDALIAATREMVRVTKPTGSIWVNLGDVYRSRGLALIPHRYAIACADQVGLTVRGEVVWSKSGKGFIDARAAGRVRKTHEYWVHLIQGTDCYASGRTATTPDNSQRPQRIRAQQIFAEAGLTDAHRDAIRAVGIIDSGGGQVRSGGRWESKNGRLAAEAREALGSYYREFCTSDRPIMPPSVHDVPVESLKIPKGVAPSGHYASFPTYWPAFFIDEWCPETGVVLDPFGGTGTTALVADVMGRHGISVDMSADYCRLAQWRTNDPKQRAKAARNPYTPPAEQVEGQESLLDLIGEESA